MDNRDNLVVQQEDKSLKILLENLSNTDGLVRRSARDVLVRLGANVIGFLGQLIEAPKYITRWESVKSLAEMHNPLAIPWLMNALEDESDDIRWLAAEGLIALGKDSVEPVLKRLIEKYPSIETREAEKHILKVLQSRDIFYDTVGLINIINHHKDESEIPTTAKAALDAWRYRKPFNSI